MKRAILIFAVGLTLLSFLIAIPKVKAEVQNNNYIISRVDHTIKVMYNGYISINDTICLVGNASEGTTIDHFLVGFSYKYGQYLLKCLAYDASGNLQVTMDVPLEGRIGFYAVKVGFPTPLNLGYGENYTFTVGFILSNDLLKALDADYYLMDVPAYPSLTKSVANCYVKFDLSEMAFDVTITVGDETINQRSYEKENLAAFTYLSANVSIKLTDTDMQLFDVEELAREIRINEFGDIEGSDSYYITSKTHLEISSIEIILPPNASNPIATDQFGRKIKDATWIDEKTGRYIVPFPLKLEGYHQIRFIVRYTLPSQAYINRQGDTIDCNISPLLFNNINCYVKQASATFIFPEGSKIQNLGETLVGIDYSLARSVFQESITISRFDVNPIENFVPQSSAPHLVYVYNFLWLSFRPTMWMWALTIVGVAVTIVWKRPKAVAVAVPRVVTRLSPETIKSFAESYEEKRKIILDLASLETRVQKGKIPRPRYKVQRKTLETRLATLNRKLAELKGTMRAAGGLYADLMRQLEVAETEINEVEANIKSIESRHSRGELSLEAYRKLLADYQRRKEKAETVINGILIRLREEIR